MTFEWDEKKNKLNIEKHGVSFEEAKTVFYDEFAWLEYDSDHSEQEDRFRLLGSSMEGNILLVVHCVRDGSSIRIISSRKATSKERKNYERRIGL
jgi:uncharacterized DUF497 family protein